METLQESQELPDVCIQQRASAERVKQIRKLRWIGMEEAANKLQIAPSDVPFEGCILTERQDTD